LIKGGYSRGIRLIQVLIHSLSKKQDKFESFVPKTEAASIIVDKRVLFVIINCGGYKMQAVEFDSYVDNGVIAIPLQYQNEVSRAVRVILLSRETTTSNASPKKKIYSLAVDMSGFTFDRNEINER